MIDTHPLITRIAFLRAINVGKGRSVKMEQLRSELESLGFTNIRTYIQSGNVVFDASEQDETAIVSLIERHLFNWLGFEVKTIVRTVTEMEAIAASIPFADDETGDTKVYVTLMSEQPASEKVQAVEVLNEDVETIKIIGREAYIRLRTTPYHKTRFSNAYIEKKLGVTATSRNTATIAKMVELGRV